MLSINTNLSSLIVQQSMSSATNKLNQAIERMTTGYKINGAKDNAANYSISQNMQTQLGSYDVAADNVAMGMDLVTTASDIISNMQDKATRLQALCTQARNGTYGAQSMSAINSEAGAIMAEINRLYMTAEYNNVSLFNREAYTIASHLPKAGKTGFINETDVTSAAEIGTTTEAPKAKSEYNGFISDPETYTDAQVAAMTRVKDVSTFTSGQKYAIYTVDELVKLRTILNDGMDTTNVEFVLGADINLKEYCEAHIADGGWVPIGDNGDYDKNLLGIFNGNGHVISNLIIKDESLGSRCLFLNVGGEVKNLGLINIDIKGGASSAGLVGGNSGTISNCYVKGSISSSGGFAGGLVGASYGVVTDCYSTCEVIASGDNVGGLIGQNSEGEVSNCYAIGDVFSSGNSVGGLIGSSPRSQITNCYATGSVTGGQDAVGGLVGAGEESVISNCYARGNVAGANFSGGLVGDGVSSQITNCYATGNVDLASNVGGGLVAIATGATISNSYAKGNVTGSSNFGGLLGAVWGGLTLTNCYAEGDVVAVGQVGGLIGVHAGVNSIISNCYATGNIEGTDNVGGLMGVYSGNITSLKDCYATGNVSGAGNIVGGLIGISMASIENCYATGNVQGSICVGGLVADFQGSIQDSYATGAVSGVGEAVGGLVGHVGLSSGTATIQDSASYSTVKGSDLTGSLIGDLRITGDEVTYGTLNIANCQVVAQDGMDYIGRVLKSNGDPIIYDLSTMLAGISTVELKSIITSLQVGINSDSSCQINFDTNFKFDISALEGNIASDEALSVIMEFSSLLSEKSTQLGAVQNRLDSAIESISVNMENLTSSLSTIRDADIAEVSSEYIRQQILQQASATLLATANQSPSIALQLI